MRLEGDLQILDHSSEVERSLHQARTWRALALLFRPPDDERVLELRKRLRELVEALKALEADEILLDTARDLVRRVAATSTPSLVRDYHDAFDASSGLRCSLNETSHTADTPQHAYTRTFELADVAGFYRAFGMEMQPGSERPDHLGAELEFLQLLAVKRAVAIERGESERATLCARAEELFLREHLSRWAGRLAHQLADVDSRGVYATAARLAEGVVGLTVRDPTP